MRLILLGCPGAGKSTLAKDICDKYGITQVTASEVLRNAFVHGSLDRATIRSMEAGELVADEVVIKLIKDRINKPDCEKGYLFDGYPRTIPQAQAIIEAGIDIDYVIEVMVSDEGVIKRLAGRRVHFASGRTYHVVFQPPKTPGRDDVTGDLLVHREDDKEKIILKRLQIYHKRTEPLRRFYRDLAAKNSKPLFLSVDGDDEIAKVRERIFGVLKGAPGKNKL